MNTNTLVTYDQDFTPPQTGCMLFVAEHKTTLYKAFNYIILRYSEYDSIYVVESKTRIDFYQFAKILRQQQKRDIITHFRNIYYCRPISLYQLSMIIEDADPYAPVLIPNFLIPLTEEGLTEIEKRQQLEVLKFRLINLSLLRPIIIGGTLEGFDEYPWVFDVLQEICVKRIWLDAKLRLENQYPETQQLNLF